MLIIIYIIFAISFFVFLPLFMPLIKKAYIVFKLNIEIE